MAEIVNLARVKRQRQRAAAAQAATENRARYGQSKIAKECARRLASRRAALLDGAKTEKPET